MAGLFSLEAETLRPAVEAEPLAADDVALLSLTSGTTGKPKIVPHSQRNLLDVARSALCEPGDRTLCLATLQERVEQALGVPVVQGYGMTETYLIATNPTPPGRRCAGSVGLAHTAQIAIRGADGQPLPAGSVGEITVAGPGVTAGYEGDPHANHFAFDGEWFRTGDLGYLDDDGYLYLTARRSELINRGGMKVSPLEVDEVLMRHPNVRLAVTFPVAHSSLGEDVAAAVVLHDAASTSSRVLREFGAAHLAPTMCRRSRNKAWPMSAMVVRIRTVARCSLLSRLARGVFGVTRGLLLLFEGGIDFRSGNALGVLARLFFRDRVCLPGSLGSALCVSQFGGRPVRRLVFGRANFSRFRRFHPCCLPFGGLRVVGQRRGAYLFQLRLLRLGRRLQPFREAWFFARHVVDLSFQCIRMGGRYRPAGLLAAREADPRSCRSYLMALPLCACAAQTDANGPPLRPAREAQSSRRLRAAAPVVPTSFRFSAADSLLIAASSLPATD